MSDIAGEWSGKISGTNNGNLFIEITQEGTSLKGIARLNDLSFGTVIYNFTGDIQGNIIALNMTPDYSSMKSSQTTSMLVNNQPVTIQMPSVQYGDISLEAKLERDSTISGKWFSTLGTGGTVYICKENTTNTELQIPPPPEENQAFVMMGISPSDHQLEDVLSSIKRATKEHDVKCIRVDEIEHTGRITDLILTYIKTSKYLICDISTERPNVYYELGYAHGLNKDVILIAREGSTIHFDIKDYNIIFYKNLTDLEAKLLRTMTAINNKNRPTK